MMEFEIGNGGLWVVGGLIIVAVSFILWKRCKDIALLKTVTDLHRGTWSERNLVLKLLKHGIPASTIFHDLYVQKPNGNYSQVDVVVATKVGIIVFEVKDYSGWIFGKGHQTHWTQVLAYGKEKYRFYNPVMQNNGHIEALKQKLNGFADVPFYSVIVFYGNCVLKDVSYIPDEVSYGGPESVPKIVNVILASGTPASYASKIGVVNVLRDAVLNGEDDEIRAQHIRNAHYATRVR